MLFCVTSNCWFEGYWWWVCPSGQSTPPQKFALWQAYGGGAGNVVPGSVVTSGTLTAGQWNYIPLPTPLQLSIGNVPGIGAAVYEAATGFSGSFPDTNSQFGAGDPYASGIASGPLFGYSDQGGSAPSPFSATAFQGAFGVAGTDPSVTMPDQGSSSSNFWIDLQISDTSPAGYSGYVFYLESRGYFGSFQGKAGPGTNGVSNGPLSSPSLAHAFNPPGGNSCYHVGTGPAYPTTWDMEDGGEHRWVDVEVTPSAASSSPTATPTPTSTSTSTSTSPVVTNSGAFLVFFP